MKVYGYILFLLLAAPVSVLAQAKRDSSFSILVNTGISFSHANDPHINKWLAKYGYPMEPHVPVSINVELAAIPAASRMLYSVKLSTIVSAKNLTSFNIFGGGYYG